MDDMKTQLKLDTITGIAADLTKTLADPGKHDIVTAKGVVAGLLAAATMVANEQERISRDESIEKEPAKLQIEALGRALAAIKSAADLNRIDIIKREAHQEAYAKIHGRLQSIHGETIAAAKAREARAEQRERDDDDYEPPARRNSTIPPARPSAPPAPAGKPKKKSKA